MKFTGVAYRFDLPAFARNLAGYLQDNLIGRLYTDDRIKINIAGDHHTLSFDVYLDDRSGFESIYVGKFSSHYQGNERIRRGFTIDSVLFDGPLHLICEKDKRTDRNEEIPFP